MKEGSRVTTSEAMRFQMEWNGGEGRVIRKQRGDNGDDTQETLVQIGAGPCQRALDASRHTPTTCLRVGRLL